MKKMSLLIASLMFVGSASFAADVENKAETTVDHSKNPITGSETTTKKTKKKIKGEHANSEVTTKEKTKTDSDGNKKTTTETETSKETK